MKFSHDRISNRSRWLTSAAICFGLTVCGLSASNRLWSAQQPDEEEQALSQDRDNSYPVPPPSAQAPRPDPARFNNNQNQTERSNTATTDLDERSGGLGVALAEEREGVRIVGLMHGSPAQRAGLQIGDKLVAIDGVNWNTTQDVVDQISSRWPNTNVLLQVERQGTTRNIDVTLTTRTIVMHEPEEPLFGQNQFNQFNMPQGQFRTGQFPGQQYQSFNVEQQQPQQQPFVSQFGNQDQCLQARINELSREVQALKDEVRILRGDGKDNTTTAQVPSPTVPQ